MAQLPDSSRLTVAEAAALALIRHTAMVRHEKERAAALNRGQVDFPSLPVECSWLFQEQFLRRVR